MQSSTASHTGNSHNWQAPNQPNMYSGGHQRNNSGPRAYTATGAAPDAKRDDTVPQGLYGSDDAYSAYQHSGSSYGGVGNVGYSGYNSGAMGLANYTSSSPSTTTAAASGSRRVSGNKGGTPPNPPASTPANPSPSSRYYPGQTQQLPDSAPYQPASAPPQVLSHHHVGGQSQSAHSAHSYGGQYQYYQDQQNPYSTWANYPNHGYSQQQQQQQSSRPSNPTSNAPGVAQNAAMGDRSVASAPAASSSPYDYPSSYPGWQHDQSRGLNAQQQWQQAQPSASRSSHASNPQAAWQGYQTSMPQTLPPHHMAQTPYSGWQQQQWASQGYNYPPPTHTAPAASSAHAGSAPLTQAAISVPAPAPAVPAPHGKKPKKEKSTDEYKGLGKRQVTESGDEGHHHEEKKEKKKKGKKEVEEKPVHKAPAKSHLHPPRQAQSAWQLFFTDELNKAKAAAAQDTSPGGTPHHAKLNVAQIAKDAGTAYGNLTDEQKAHYAKRVQESKKQYAKDLVAWQATLTPEDIRAENAFRAQQRKEGKSRKGNLKDPNAPKKPLSAYFLFLKGIRENDDIRERVWGGETETTKQSVLAAEKWRSLTDEEKKPYLSQAEQDKAQYEVTRKLYEDDAAARARGEDVPVRDVPVQARAPKLQLKPLEAGVVEAEPAADVQPTPAIVDVASASDPALGDFTETHNSSDNTPARGENGEFDHSLEMDEFHGFNDPLDDMEFSGLEGITSAIQPIEPQWEDLHKLMGSSSTDDGYGEAKAEPAQVTAPAPAPVLVDEVEELKPTEDTLMESEDVSVAPTIEEATAETTGLQIIEPVKEENVQAIASAAEGELAVPRIVEESIPVEETASGVPTEEVNELPPADVPAISEVPVETAEQERTDAAAVVESTEEVAPEEIEEATNAEEVVSTVQDFPAVEGV